MTDIKRGMKQITIKKAMRWKMRNWLKSITDENLRRDIAKSAYVTGGSIASMLLGEKVNDFDIYFKDKETLVKVCEYYITQFKKNNPDNNVEMKVRDSKEVNLNGVEEDVVDIFVRSSGVAESTIQKAINIDDLLADINGMSDSVSDPDIGDDDPAILDDLDATKTRISGGGDTYQPMFITSNAITLSNKIQIVVRFYGEPEEVHKNYDFVHCTNWYDLATDQLVLQKEALESLMSRDLKYVGTLFPICSLFRIRKFVERGWRITAGEMVKIAMQTRKIDWDNVQVLKSQLMGVDTTHFRIFIKTLEDDIAQKKALNNAYAFKFDETYVFELLDKIFD